MKKDRTSTTILPGTRSITDFFKKPEPKPSLIDSPAATNPTLPGKTPKKAEPKPRSPSVFSASELPYSTSHSNLLTPRPENGVTDKHVTKPLTSKDEDMEIVEDVMQPKSSSTPVPSNFLNANKRFAVSEPTLSRSPKKVPRLASPEDENEDKIGFGDVPETLEDDEDDDMLENAAILLLSPSKKKAKEESYENIKTQDILEEENFPSPTSDINSSRRSSRSSRNPAPAYAFSLDPLDGSNAEKPAQLMRRLSRGSTISSKFTIANLLLEKKKKVKKGYDSQMLEELFNDLNVPHVLDHRDSDPSDPSAPPINLEEMSRLLPGEKSEQLKEILAEKDTNLRSFDFSFFSKWTGQLPQPKLNLTAHATTHDRFLQAIQTYSKTAAKRHFFLCNGWLIHRYKRGWNCPAEVFAWLFEIVGFDSDKEVVDAAVRTLECFFSDLTITGPSDTPNLLGSVVSVDELMRVLGGMGAPEEYLMPDQVLHEEEEETDGGRRQESGKIAQSPRAFPFWNLTSALRVFTLSVWSRPHIYDSTALRRAVVILLRCALDTRVNNIMGEIEQALKAVLWAFDKADWSGQVKRLAFDIVTAHPSPHHQSHMLAALSPICPRSCVLRRLVATECLIAPHSEGGGSWMDNIDVTGVIPITPLESVLLEAGPNSMFAFRRTKMDYYRLLAVVTILGYTLEDERALKAQGAVVRRIEKQLRIMHGKIGKSAFETFLLAFFDSDLVVIHHGHVKISQHRLADLRAAFLDRTMAKDVILRLQLRLYYMACHERVRTGGQKTLNFGAEKDDMHEDEQEDKEVMEERRKAEEGRRTMEKIIEENRGLAVTVEREKRDKMGGRVWRLEGGGKEEEEEGKEMEEDEKEERKEERKEEKKENGIETEDVV
ncbi:hypothetical protein BC937DRAFT_94381 [Endogone sp. FLAS-F59071]|nr:hypothetical protein BC937DRAFT_94381 [Endogone sp. FLAS-F59071]|eukprot:RUS20787.1 hypothetical protein BC937DRAFT_94381 [Endogone sp. FLAS-F59071]